MAASPRVRFAPSPTGYLHIGGARTALFNWLYARRFGGTFVVRVEDTDLERSTDESVKALFDGLRWLDLDWDEGPQTGGPHGPYFQMQRLELYRSYSDQLMAEGKAYRCYCTKEDLEAKRQAAEKEKRNYQYDGTCRDRQGPPPNRPSVIRLRAPKKEGQLAFTDKVIGTISKERTDLDDWVMLRADGIPVYHFGCVIDDHLMEITLVARGQEHINSTFPQLMLYEALGWQPPEFAHLPLILGPDREKLSKRRHPEADVMLHRRNGILPEALLNFVVRLGWSHGNDEFITRDQMREWFDFDHVGSTSGVWNPDKLLWVNQQYLKTLPPSVVAERLVPFLEERGVRTRGYAHLEQLVVSYRDRCKTLKEMAESAHWIFATSLTFDEKAVAKQFTPEGLALLAAVESELNGVEHWDVPSLDAVVKRVAETKAVGMGKVAQPLRVALTGTPTSPGIGETLVLLGRDEALARIRAAPSRVAVAP